MLFVWFYFLNFIQIVTNFSLYDFYGYEKSTNTTCNLLLKKFTIQRPFSKRNTAGFSRTSNDLFWGEYVKSVEYYLQIDNNKPRKFKLNKNSLVIAASYESPELMEYLKNYRPTINTIEDLRGIYLFNL